MRKFSLKSKKGVSPIIATLLLIVIAVAAAVVTYSFVMGFIGTGTGQSGTTGQINIESYSIQNNQTVFYVRNVGNKLVTVTSAYVDGVSYTINPANQNLNIGAVQQFTIAYTSADAGATSHTLKVVCADGTQASISIRAPT
ncbi:MAG: hypothetical protein QFX34_01745 [Candidatus Verstraetearchaeota archaeon]|nr:hypothetical protein [Candidatus Verstraetearchaeota archaeon]